MPEVLVLPRPIEAAAGLGTGQALYERAKRLIPGGTQLLSKRPEMFLPDQWPAYYSRAKGAAVWDLDGIEYIDMTSSAVGTCPLGYADEDVDAAVVAAVKDGSMATLNCAEEVELAELLCELHPWAQMCRFARTGGESMAIAVRIARAYTRRSVVAVCGYHGWSDWYLAANRAHADALGGEGLLLPGLDPRGVPEELAGTTVTFRHNDIDGLHAVAREHAGRLAAIICEPQRGERPKPGFLEAARQLADEAGAVLVFDEVSSALRLSTGGVHMLYGVKPDMAVFAKGIGNGFPIGAVIGTADIMEAAQTTFISSTYWTERIGPVAALTTLRRFADIDGPQLLVDAGRRVQSIWRDVGEAAGLAVEVGHPDMPPFSHLAFSHAQPQAVRTLYCQLMLERGYLDNGNFYATCAHTNQILDRYAEAVRDAFGHIYDAVRAERVAEELKGPVAHTGFARLTSS
jgi:glutamate-1-semialdehyde 2,1-aminomutase